MEDVCIDSVSVDLKENTKQNYQEFNITANKCKIIKPGVFCTREGHNFIGKINIPVLDQIRQRSFQITSIVVHAI